MTGCLEEKLDLAVRATVGGFDVSEYCGRYYIIRDWLEVKQPYHEEEWYKQEAIARTERYLIATKTRSVSR